MQVHKSIGTKPLPISTHMANFIILYEILLKLLNIKPDFQGQKGHLALCSKANHGLKKRAEGQNLACLQRTYICFIFMILEIICPSFFQNWPKKCKKAKILHLSGLNWPIIGRPRPKFELDVRNLHIYPHTKFERLRLNTF